MQRFQVLGMVGLATVWLGGTAPSVVYGQGEPSKLLEDARIQTELARQKIEADVQAALASTRSVAPGHTEEAIARLNQALVQLLGDSALSPARRDALVRAVQDRLRQLDSRPSGTGTNPTKGESAGKAAGTAKAGQKAVEEAERDAQRAARKQQLDRERAEANAIQSRLDSIARLQREGKSFDALKVADELSRQYPTNPAAQAMRRKATLTERIAEARAILAEMEQRLTQAYREIERAALPSVENVEFPKDWKEKTEKRLAALKPSAREMAILKALNTKVPQGFQNTPISEVLQYLTDLTNEPIVLSKSELDEAKITSDTPVSFQARNVTVRTVLRSILSEFGMTYVIRDGTIQVTSIQRAREMLVTRSYPIGDLVIGTGQFGNPLLWGPGLSQLQMQQNVAQIIETIQSTIDPQSWRSAGGPGTISYHPPTGSLIIRQTAEVHAMLRGSIGR